ncbi:hypothetical protein [Rufibacter psychrotolerans]|uniref:hypothetical protein n=1 Tax=Rufibacter psychrotolerans TaxID=2812556 RepID=UPI0019675295|nr:hypothetical protein [Rufibacter sp. SYSU D00308]
MIIYLQDIEKDEEIKADLTVEYAFPGQDLFVVFSSSIHTGNSTLKEYQWQKVSHLAGGCFSYGGRKYSATLGFFLSGQQLIPVLVDGACADEDYSGFGFGVAEQAYGHYPTQQALFHYPVIPSLLDEGEKPLTFREAAAKALTDRRGEGNKAYDLTPAQGFRLEALVGHAEFSAFMERQLTEPQVS